MRNLLHLVILAGGAILFASGCKEKNITKMTLPEVIVQPAVSVSFKEYIPSISNIQAYDSVDLVARVEGFLLKSNFKEGQDVKKGDLLFLIEPDKYEAALKIAEASLLQAEAELKNTAEDYERQKVLLNKDAASKRTFENAEAKKMKADAMVMEAHARIKEAKLNLSYTKVYAPFDGRISFKSYSEGNLVGPSSAKLATLLRSGPVKVDFRFNELDMLRLMEQDIGNTSKHRNIPVELFFQDGKKYKLNGKIESYDNRVNESTGTFKIRAVFDNPEGDLIPGMYVKVRVPTSAPQKTLSVPPEAVQTDMSGDYVYVIGKDNVVQRRSIKSQRQDRSVYITSGLKENENIVVEGITKVRNGVQVQPKVQKNSAGDGI